MVLHLCIKIGTELLKLTMSRLCVWCILAVNLKYNMIYYDKRCVLIWIFSLFPNNQLVTLLVPYKFIEWVSEWVSEWVNEGGMEGGIRYIFLISLGCLFTNNKANKFHMLCINEYSIILLLPLFTGSSNMQSYCLSIKLRKVYRVRKNLLVCVDDKPISCIITTFQK